jgi:hypothetical protein
VAGPPENGYGQKNRLSKRAALITGLATQFLPSIGLKNCMDSAADPAGLNFCGLL